MAKKKQAYYHLKVNRKNGKFVKDLTTNKIRVIRGALDELEEQNFD